MNKQTMLIIGIGVLVLVAGLLLLTSRTSTQNSGDAMEQSEESMEAGESMMQTDPADAMMEGEEAIETDAMMEEPSMESEEQGMMKKGSYVPYSEQTAIQAAQDGKAVLFFHASWCPTCKVANEAFTSRSGEIPAGVTVLKTDYDTEAELKAKYGITYQHTFVQIDENGNEITKWNGGDIEELGTNIQ